MRDGEGNRGRFPDNHRFYYEFRCSYPMQEGDLCSRCLEWKSRGVNKKDLYRCHHGLVTEEIPEWSHIYGGIWYQSKVSVYGEPSESEMARAKKAEMDARKGLDVDTTKELNLVEEPKKKRPYNKKKKNIPKPEPQPEPQPEPKQQPEPQPEPKQQPQPETKQQPQSEPKPQPQPTTVKKRRAKKEPATIPEEPNVQIQAVEVTPMIHDIEIVKIIVRPFTVNDTAYFLDGKKNKLYSVGNDKRPSSYVGRWNPDSQIIDTEFPDSDVE